MLPDARSFQVRRIGEGHLDCMLQDAAGGRVRAVAFRAADRPLGEALLAAGGRAPAPRRHAQARQLAGRAAGDLPDRGRRALRLSRRAHAGRPGALAFRGRRR